MSPARDACVTWRVWGFPRGRALPFLFFFFFWNCHRILVFQLLNGLSTHHLVFTAWPCCLCPFENSRLSVDCTVSEPFLFKQGVPKFPPCPLHTGGFLLPLWAATIRLIKAVFSLPLCQGVCVACDVLLVIKGIFFFFFFFPHLTLFFLFWLTCGIGSPQARDQSQTSLSTYGEAAATLDP